MDNVWGLDVSAAPPSIPADAPTGYPTDGSSTGGVKATTPKAFWYYMIAEEIINAIKGGGVLPDRQVLNQLNKSIDLRIQKAAEELEESIGDVLEQVTKFETTPTGSLIQMPIDQQPSEYWLKCDGRAVSRDSYAKLFALIGTKFGSGNGSTTFNLPDYRGCVLRVLDDGRGYDSGRAIGTYQADAMQPITGGWLGTEDAYKWVDGAIYSGGAYGSSETHHGHVGTKMLFDSSRVVRTASETRMKNYSITVWIHV